MDKRKLGYIISAAMILAAACTAAVLYFAGRESAKQPKTNDGSENIVFQGTGADDPSSEQSAFQMNWPDTIPENLWIMGDSLAAGYKTNAPETGWGTMLQQYLTSDVMVRDIAIGGASSSSYAKTSTYESAMKDMKEGDYVIIQFGHNDAWYEDRMTDPYGDPDTPGSFQYVLMQDYIQPILEKGGYVILATSVVGCFFDEEDVLYEMLYADHAQAMRELAEECRKREMNVALIDMYEITRMLYQELGSSGAAKFHAADQIHYNTYGAVYVAGLTAREIQKLGAPCFQDIRTMEEVIAGSEMLQKKIEDILQ